MIKKPTKYGYVNHSHKSKFFLFQEKIIFYFIFYRNILFIVYQLSVSVSADMGKFISVIYRYWPIRKLDLSAVIGIGRYEKKLIDRTLVISMVINTMIFQIIVLLNFLIKLKTEEVIHGDLVYKMVNYLIFYIGRFDV